MNNIIASSGNYKDDCGIYLIVSEIDTGARLRPEGVRFSVNDKQWSKIDAAIKADGIDCKYYDADKPVKK